MPLLKWACRASMIGFLALAASCGSGSRDTASEGNAPETALQNEVQKFLDEYNAQYVKLYYQASEAEWALNTRIVEGDTVTARRAEEASKAMAEFTGSEETIAKTTQYLEQKNSLTPLQRKQLEKILYAAANNPQTIKDKVDERIKATTKQTQDLFGFTFKIGDREVTPNQIDSILNASSDLKTRLAAWEASKEVGKKLKPGLTDLQRLRNETVNPLGYSDYFTYQVSDYGMTTEEMMELNKQMVRDIWPLYRELHTYARYELAKKYKSPVPDMLPAHWLPNRWAQDWSGMINVEGVSVDDSLQKRGAEWVMRKGEEFYVSLGMPELPQSFYTKSSLYPVPPGAGYKKNNHASAWHMDLDQDVRSLMSVEPNTDWYETVNHELGHIYYYLAYSRPEVPHVLREGANRAFHEAFGTMIGMAAMQMPFLKNHNLVPPDQKVDTIQTLLKQAMNYVVFIPFSAGTTTHFEHDLYVESLPADQYNARWWQYVQRFQGVVPPSARGEQYADAASKTHINDDPAQYYDYALSTILLFQIHDHIARNILKQDPRFTNYYGSKETGDFLTSIMKEGGTRDWRELLREKTGSDLSAKPMLEYFNPLMAWMKEQNKGRKYTLPETI